MRLRGVDLMDGTGLQRGMDVEIARGRIAEIRPGVMRADAPLVCPAPLDLQVNGGGGRMLGDCEAPGDVLEILAAHRRLGTGAILPTLISDTPEVTARVIRLVAAAQAVDDGILGLHLEGPHIALAGAHDAALLRDLTDADVEAYIAARARLGRLMVTLAPERASPAQVARLAAGGVIVALGHSECDLDSALAAFAAGAVMATHLFNAMSGLHHRAPGLAAAALLRARWFGLIADGHHVAEGMLKVALLARPEAAIPVSDAMAVAGTAATEFRLAGRRVTRRDGRLTLAGGRLAGADLSLVEALARLAEVQALPLAEVLAMGFDRPHRLLFGRPNRLVAGAPARLLSLEDDRIEACDGAHWHRLA